MHRFVAPSYYPLLFRPLVEFMASVPNEERRTPRKDSVLQRRAFQGIVPQIVLERRGKGSGQGPFDRSIRVAEPWHDLLRRYRLVEMGVFDGHAWQATLERARHGVFEAQPTLCASISTRCGFEETSAVILLE
jgi:asparagine synthase (glutamine-hydrolysing)